jgi:hypothetical protein
VCHERSECSHQRAGNDAHHDATARYCPVHSLQRTVGLADEHYRQHGQQHARAEQPCASFGLNGIAQRNSFDQRDPDGDREGDGSSPAISMPASSSTLAMLKMNPPNYDPNWRRRFLHLALRGEWRIAKVAMARKLAVGGGQAGDFSESAVRAFARRISPGVVVGRMQHEGIIAYSRDQETSGKRVCLLLLLAIPTKNRKPWSAALTLSGARWPGWKM